jgi:large subunit ribosomal protein L9
LSNVERLGKPGAVVKVKPGFGRNFLIPRGLALPATPAHMRDVEERARQAQGKAQRLRKQAESLKQKLEARSLTLKLTLGEGGAAFGSISVHDLAEALAQDKRPVDRAMIKLEEPIKSLGIYEVPIRLHADVTAALKVWVVKA